MRHNLTGTAAMRLSLPLFAIVAGLSLAACSQPRPDASGTFGADPQIGAPTAGAIPTLNNAKAVGWPAGGAPVPAAGFTVTRYAEGLAHPRWLYLLPNGDVLVAEATSHPSTGRGIETQIANNLMRSGGAFAGDANHITLLRDADGDGDVDLKTPFIVGLSQPMGMALIGDSLYVANTDALLRFPYTPDATSITTAGEKIIDLPHHAANNGHWTRTLAASADGTKLFIAIGSASNIGEAGAEAEKDRAAIWELELATKAHRVFASGLRNPVGIGWEPSTQTLWTSVNERDLLGDDLVPDYFTSVKDGAFYGWPYSYYGQHVDTRVKPQDAALVARAIAPDYALGAHTASLGLHFYTGTALPAAYRGGAFIGQHGSWNRSVPAGYKVIFVPFANGKPNGEPQDFLTGFLNARGEAQGRPVGVAQDRTGAILVADDVGKIVWRVAPQ
ncbi:MAG: L-sorbosone dehydrogenase [Alphaproteobacteria bacterium]|nr:MAG: L-sorbosone dehydrogenase [Caulobacteraceae bacterium]TPW07624.1 MAG: L-sorbosone dehydrogenase [Alphaproteobacteria bacterium]